MNTITISIATVLALIALLLCIVLLGLAVQLVYQDLIESKKRNAESSKDDYLE